MAYEIETIMEDWLHFKQSEKSWAQRYCVLDLLGSRIIVFNDRSFANEVRDIKFSKYDVLQNEEDMEGKAFVWSVGRTGGKTFYFAPIESLERPNRRRMRLNWMKMMRRCVEQGGKHQLLNHAKSLPSGANYLTSEQSERRRLLSENVELVRAQTVPIIQTRSEAPEQLEPPQTAQRPQTGIAREGTVQFKNRGIWESRFLRLYIDQKNSALLIYPTQMMVGRPEKILLANCSDYVTESGNLVFGVIQSQAWGRKQQYDFVPPSGFEKEAWKEDILLAIECAKQGLDFYAERRRRHGDWCIELTAKCQQACLIL